MESGSKWELRGVRNAIGDIVGQQWARLDTQHKHPEAMEMKPVPPLVVYREFSDSDWSTEEIEYLWNQIVWCNFNMAIVYDRYDFRDTKRCLEEIKEKYNEICLCTPSLSSLHDPEYDREKSRIRRSRLEEVFNRSKTYMSEEAQVLDEVKQIADDFGEIIGERTKVLRLFGNDMLALIDGAIKRGVCETPPKMEERPSQRDKGICGPHLRSTRLRGHKPGFSKGIEKTLTEHHLLTAKPLYPSANICKMYEDVRTMANKILECEKIVARLSQETKAEI